MGETRFGHPVVRFRGAIVEMEALIDAAAHEPDFASQVEDLFQMKVAPALLEIRELVADVTATVRDAKTCRRR